MAAITTVYFGTASVPVAVRRRTARRFVCLFVAGTAGGKNAAGAALLRRDGTCVVTTAPSPETLILERDFRNIYTAIDDDAVALFGYARGASAAAPRRPATTHPVKIGPTVVLYDGDVANARALAADLGLADNGDGADLVARLVNMALEKGTVDDAAAITSTRLRLLDGTFSVVAWDRRLPESLLIGRYRRDLEVYRDEANGLVYVSNQRGLLGKMFGAGAATAFPDNAVWLCDSERAVSPYAKIFPGALLRRSEERRGGLATGAHR